MPDRVRLGKLITTLEQVHQSMLGAHWEERLALRDLEEKLKHEIRHVVRSNGIIRS